MAERDDDVNTTEGAEAAATPQALSHETAADATRSADPVRGRLAWLRGTILALVGGLVPFCTMAYERPWRFSVPIGFLGLLVAVVGIFDALGTLSDDEADVVARTKASAIAKSLGVVVASVVAHVAALTLAVGGTLPAPILTAAVLVTGTFLWVVVAVFNAARSLGAWSNPEGEDAPLLRRHGFWLVTISTLVNLPMLGSYSLSDPWETHYGEVAREMLARNDWISLWWAQDGWFWSKPVFDFWIQGLAFSLLGVKYGPDLMLSGVEKGHFPQPEWAARMPVFLITLIATYLLYRAVTKVWGQRTGLLAGIILTTMPYWYFIGHQTMTDMPYVGTLTAGMALMLSGFLTDPEKRVPVYEVGLGGRAVRLSAFHLVFGAILLCALPQILYLLTRHTTLHLSSELLGFRPHPDEFFEGSGGGNCGLPGNRACHDTPPVLKSFWPLHGAGLWSAVLAFLVWGKRHERRAQRLYFLAGWFFVALAALAKGAPGLVLPLAAVAGFVFVTRRWNDLERLELPAFLLIVGAVTLPWYVQMYARHGHPFIDRLIMHDMYKRAFVHVHDTNQGDDVSFRYYVWQLGYGLFPWSGLAAGGLLWWLRRDDQHGNPKTDAATLFVLWFLAAFGMFTITLTKFHHYIFPLVPPTAALTAVLIHRALGEGGPARAGRQTAYLLSTGAGLLLVLYGIARLFPRRFTGEALSGAAPWMGWGVVSIVCGLALTIAAAWLLRTREAEPQREASDAPEFARRNYQQWMLGLVGLVSATSVALSGRDLIVSNKGDVEGQMRLMQLFTYNYKRPWPESLDFTGALWAFTAAGVGLSLLMVFRRLRPHATAMFCSVAVLWAGWGVNVYLVKASPHWGQRETILEYYKQRASPNEPIVAYQMNWKGENFYSGNKIPAFVSSGKKFKDWLEEQKQAGVNVMYFTTEHGRIGSLKRELGDVKSFEKLTDESLNNKFFLGRAEF